MCVCILPFADGSKLEYYHEEYNLRTLARDWGADYETKSGHCFVTGLG